MTDNRPVINENYNDEAYKAPVNEVNPNNRVSGEVVEGDPRTEEEAEETDK